jgi:hypothetical protein
MARTRGRYPQSEREARRRTRRKLKALVRRADELVLEAAGYWDEGIVSSSMDMLLDAVKDGVAGVEEAMETQIELSDYRETEA